MHSEDNVHIIIKQINLVFLDVGQDIQFEVIIEAAMIKQEYSKIYIFHATKMNLNAPYQKNAFHCV